MNRKNRVYISGPITGIPDYLENFEKVEKELTKAGYSVINPAKLNANMPDGIEYEEFLEIDLKYMDLCDSIYMMKGWQNSKGANREYGYALGKGMKIVDIELQTSPHLHFPTAAESRIDISRSAEQEQYMTIEEADEYIEHIRHQVLTGRAYPKEMKIVEGYENYKLHHPGITQINFRRLMNELIK